MTKKRAFFVCRCQNDQCPRRVFAERLPDVVAPRARMTLRFDAALQAIGFASSGEAGARLATFLGMPTSPSTVLRWIKETTFPSQQVTKIGIDDFAFRRGLKYGTILVDLETHRVVDLLPDRSVATATAWFKKHPEIRVISRDRGADYAMAASQGSPQYDVWPSKISSAAPARVTLCLINTCERGNSFHAISHCSYD